MADFKIAHEITKGNEGGYSNDPKDRGGETIYGIARKHHPNWTGWILVDKYPKTPSGIKSMLADKEIKSLADKFYKAAFWDMLSLDKLNNQDIANEMYDSAVNLGPKTVAIWLQRALNVANRNEADYKDIPTTGNIGPLTLKAINEHKNVKAIWKALNVLQGYAYFSIAEKDKSQERFWNGWMNRVF